MTIVGLPKLSEPEPVELETVQSSTLARGSEGLELECFVYFFLLLFVCWGGGGQSKSRAQTRPDNEFQGETSTMSRNRTFPTSLMIKRFGGVII